MPPSILDFSNIRRGAESARSMKRRLQASERLWARLGLLGCIPIARPSLYRGLMA